MKRSIQSCSLLVILTCQAHAGLVFYSDFEGNGLDKSGFGNHVTWVGSQNYVSSAHGQAIRFDNAIGNVAATHYGKIPNSVSIRSLETSSFTVGFYMSVTDNSQLNGRLFGGGFGGAQIVFDYNAQTVPGAYGQLMDNSSQAVTTQPFAASNPNMVVTDGAWKWSFLVLDRQAGEMRQYVDSNLVAVAAFSSLDAINFPELFIGAVAGQTAYAARLTSLDDLAIWNHALTDEEIEEVVTNGVVPEPVTLIGLGAGLAFILKRRKKR